MEKFTLLFFLLVIIALLVTLFTRIEAVRLSHIAKGFMQPKVTFYHYVKGLGIVITHSIMVPLLLPIAILGLFRRRKY